jgi:hypothetical protein
MSIHYFVAFKSLDLNFLATISLALKFYFDIKYNSTGVLSRLKWAKLLVRPPEEFRKIPKDHGNPSKPEGLQKKRKPLTSFDTDY